MTSSHSPRITTNGEFMGSYEEFLTSPSERTLETRSQKCISGSILRVK